MSLDLGFAQKWFRYGDDTQVYRLHLRTEWDREP